MTDQVQCVLFVDYIASKICLHVVSFDYRVGQTTLATNDLSLKEI